MEIVITSGEILSFIFISAIFFIGMAIGYFVGRYDGRKGL